MYKESDICMFVLSYNLKRTHKQMDIIEPNDRIRFGKTYDDIGKFSVHVIVGLPIFGSHKLKTNSCDG